MASESAAAFAATRASSQASFRVLSTPPLNPPIPPASSRLPVATTHLPLQTVLLAPSFFPSPAQAHAARVEGANIHHHVRVQLDMKGMYYSV